MSEEVEIWKPFPELPQYAISTFGRIKNIQRNKVLSPCLNRGRDYNIRLCGKTRKIHQLVAITFLEHVIGKTHVDHIDGNPKNNHYLNLRWCTHAENIKFAWDLGLYKHVGSKHGMSKLNEISVAEIKREISDGGKNYIIAKKFNVSQQTVCDIRKGRLWNHV